MQNPMEFFLNIEKVIRHSHGDYRPYEHGTKIGTIAQISFDLFLFSCATAMKSESTRTAYRRKISKKWTVIFMETIALIRMIHEG